MDHSEPKIAVCLNRRIPELLLPNGRSHRSINFRLLCYLIRWMLKEAQSFITLTSQRRRRTLDNQDRRLSLCSGTGNGRRTHQSLHLRLDVRWIYRAAESDHPKAGQAHGVVQGIRSRHHLQPKDIWSHMQRSLDLDTRVLLAETLGLIPPCSPWLSLPKIWTQSLDLDIFEKREFLH